MEQVATFEAECQGGPDRKWPAKHCSCTVDYMKLYSIGQFRYPYEVLQSTSLSLCHRGRCALLQQVPRSGDLIYIITFPARFPGGAAAHNLGQLLRSPGIEFLNRCDVGEGETAFFIGVSGAMLLQR